MHVLLAGIVEQYDSDASSGGENTREQMKADGRIEEMARRRDEGKVRFLGMPGTLTDLRIHGLLCTCRDG